MDELLTPLEVAGHLKVSRQTLMLWRLADPQEGPAFFRVGRQIRYRKADVVAWLTETQDMAS